MNKAELKFTIEIKINGALITRNYEALFQKLLTKRTALSFHELALLIPAFKLHKFNIESSDIRTDTSGNTIKKFSADIKVQNVI